MTIEQITALFQWMTIINAGIFIISALLVMLLKRHIIRWHGNLFGIQEHVVSSMIYGYLGLFKVLLILFNIVPWIALLIIN